MNDESNLYMNIGTPVSGIDKNKLFAALSSDYVSHWNTSNSHRISGDHPLPNVHYLTLPKHDCWLKVNDSFRVACKTYPNKFHRFFIKLIFGWEYEKI